MQAIQRHMCQYDAVNCADVNRRIIATVGSLEQWLQIVKVRDAGEIVQFDFIADSA